jgi:hypothetical protein
MSNEFSSNVKDSRLRTENNEGLSRGSDGRAVQELYSPPFAARTTQPGMNCLSQVRMVRTTGATVTRRKRAVVLCTVNVRGNPARHKST